MSVLSFMPRPLNRRGSQTGNRAEEGTPRDPLAAGKERQTASGQAAGSKALARHEERGRLQDRLYSDLTDPNYASRYMSEAAMRMMGGFGGQARAGAQVGAMGDVGRQSADYMTQNIYKALDLQDKRIGQANEIEYLKLDARDRLMQVIQDNRDSSGKLTSQGRNILETELARLEASIGPQPDLRAEIIQESNASGPNWLQRLFGARG